MGCIGANCGHVERGHGSWPSWRTCERPFAVCLSDIGQSVGFRLVDQQLMLHLQAFGLFGHSFVHHTRASSSRCFSLRCSESRGRISVFSADVFWLAGIWMNLISSDGISTATMAVRTADASRNRLRLFVQFCTLRRRRFVFDLYSQLFTITSRVMDSFGGYTATVRTMRGPVFDPYLVFGRI